MFFLPSTNMSLVPFKDCKCESKHQCLIIASPRKETKREEKRQKDMKKKKGSAYTLPLSFYFTSQVKCLIDFMTVRQPDSDTGFLTK